MAKKELSLRGMLSDHILRRIRKHRILTGMDYGDLPTVHCEEFFEKLQKRMAAVPFVLSIRFDLHMHSPAMAQLLVRFRDGAGGMYIDISHHGPLCRWRFKPEEALSPIPPNTPIDEIERLLQEGIDACERKTPPRSKLLCEQILDELGDLGLISFPEGGLEVRPMQSAKFPKQLKKATLEELFFDYDVDHNDPLLLARREVLGDN